MAHDENEGHGFGPVLWVILACIVGALILVALVLPRDTTSFFLSLNDRFNTLFENKTFITLRFIAGLLTVGLAALATWLFFRLLEMEREHENHVYHHTDHMVHTHESEHEIDESVDDEEEHTPPPDFSLNEFKDEATEEGSDDTSLDEPLQPSQEGQTKTAPPPPRIFQARLPGESGVRGVQIGEDHPGHFQWQSVLRLATSHNPSDWKLAIIEADVILDMMTYIQGFPGDTLGERLKNADPGFFKNLDYAKKAHWTRNQIAHNPNMQFTPREINQAIRMYETVFNEFKYI